MLRTTFMMFAVGFYFVAIIIVLVVLFVVDKKVKKKYVNMIDSLERDKNLIVSPNIMSELNKVEALVNNDDLKKRYNEWQARFEEIQNTDIPKITDLINSAQALYEERDDKALKQAIVNIEIQVNLIKTKADYLLEEIKEITLSEERNRDKITKLKTEYRSIMTTYKENTQDYIKISKPIELQFENVDKLFSNFESAMDKNSYLEVGKIVKAIDGTIANLSVIIKETKTICQYGEVLIPNKILDIKSISDKMIDNGYNLEYLNIDYNIEETRKKIKNIFDRLNVLDVTDSVFMLKTMLDYYDSLYEDFEKERTSKITFDEYTKNLINKLSKLETFSNNLYKTIGEIKYSYDLADDDLSVIGEIRDEIADERVTYDLIIDHFRGRVFAYSKLSKEMEALNLQIIATESKLRDTLEVLNSLKDDEKRAKEQLEEIKDTLLQTKEKERISGIPIIPKNYYVELDEAIEAVKILANELEKRPISIKLLNTRVDTARDLVLKVYNTINEAIKTAKMAESAIVYGNRYRAINREVEQGLLKAEGLFFKGNYKLCLEQAINSINLVEPGIYQKLLDSFVE